MALCLLALAIALVHAAIAHGLVLAGTGLHLGAVEGHQPEPDHAGRLAEVQAVEEERLEGGETPTATR